MFRSVFRNRKRKATGGVLAALVVAGLTVGVAFAYYGGSGTGTATASAGHAPRTVSVTGSLAAADSPLYPGGSGVVNIAVSLTGSGNAHVGSVSATAIHTSNEPACNPAWFSFTPPAAAQFPAGANVSSGSPLNVTGTLAFVDSGTLQDACSDATVTLDLVANPT